jgi:hypothetical protein
MQSVFNLYKLLNFSSYNIFQQKKNPHISVKIFVAKTGVEPVTSGL